MRKKTSTILAAFVALAFVVSAGLVFFTERGAAQVTTRWNLCRVLGAGYDGCGLDMEGLDNVTATGTITAGYFVGDGSGLTGISGLLTEHVVYVADNGNDTTGNGSEFNPVQSLTKALTLVPGSTNGLIMVGHGTFSADTLVFDDVSISGTGSTIITGSFELRGDASVSGATLTGIISTYEDNAFNRVYLANGRLVVKTGAAFRGQQVYTLSADAGYIPITVEAGASLTINYSEIKTAAGITPVQSAGSIEISNSSIEVAVGTEGGNSLSLSSTGGFVKLSNVAVYGARHTGINIENGATSAAPNVLNNVVSNKNIVAGTAYTYYEGLVFTDTATITGSELHNTYIGDLAVSGLITASGNIESTSGDLIAFDDFIVGDDVWIAPGGKLIFDYPTGTEYFTWNGTKIYTPSPIDTDDDITTSGGLAGGGCIITAVGEIECYSDILTTTGDIEATTGVVTAAGFETAGNATAAYFIGDGSMLTGLPAAGDFKADGSVPMTGAYTSGIFGTNGYDFTQAGYYNSSYQGKMFWDADKLAFRAGRLSDTSWDSGNVGLFSVAMAGTNPKASAQDSMAFGSLTVASAQYAVVMGVSSTASGIGSAAHGQWVTSSAKNAMTIGKGVSDSVRLTNATESSFMVGFNSTVPTFFVSAGSGAGTYGQVGIGTTSPLAGSLIDVEGVLNSASITSEGAIAATGTISSVAGYIANGSPGIDKSATVCCAWDVDLTCSATGTVTVTKGLITAWCP